MPGFRIANCVLAIASVVFLTSATAPERVIQPRPVKVSMVQLLANPNSYEGRLIRVRGYVRLEFEGNAIYLHREDYEQAIYENGLWLNTSGCGGPSGETFEQGYAMVIGEFTASEKGHMGLWPGTIEAASCFILPKK